MNKMISTSVDETIECAKTIAGMYGLPCVYCIDGELGAGKTAFTRGLICGYGIDARITSPTFGLMNVYGNGICHFDFYRIETIQQLYEIGFFDHLNSGLVIVEWGSKFYSAFEGVDHVKVDIQYTYREGERVICYELISNRNGN